MCQYILIIDCVKNVLEMLKCVPNVVDLIKIQVKAWMT